MAQTTILAAAQTAGTSTDITVADGQTVKVGLFAATGTGPIPARFVATVYEDTPGDDNPVVQLHAGAPTAVLAGPGTYRVVRPSIAHLGVNVGVYTE